MSWQKIWSSRKIEKLNDPFINENVILRNLLLLDGFDSPTGNIVVSSWESFINKLINELSFNSNNSVYEVGCGGGAFLYPFYKKGMKVGGLDYSASLIEICQKIMPTMNFNVSEASELNTDLQFDFVSAFSVFFYFKDYNYANNVLEKMYNKSRKGVMILDIPNIDTKSECEIFRKGSMDTEEYNAKYKDLQHLYYPKSFFEKFAIMKNAKFFKIEDQSIDEYCNNKFRFNFIMLK